MANNLKFATNLRNALMDAITTFAGGSALIRIYDGTQATNPNTAIGAQVLLAELTCNATFAPGAASGVLTLNAITTDSSANATGTASWFRLVKSDGTTAVLDGTVGTSGSDLNINSVAISSGAAVAITSATITAGNA
jgi:hypothetical protein